MYWVVWHSGGHSYLPSYILILFIKPHKIEEYLEHSAPKPIETKFQPYPLDFGYDRLSHFRAAFYFLIIIIIINYDSTRPNDLLNHVIPKSMTS